MSRAKVRYTLDAAHNRRRFERDGVALAIGSREPRILPVDSRLPIVVRAGFHPDEHSYADAVDLALRDAWCWLAARALTFDRWLWGARGRRFIKRLAICAVGAIALVAVIHRL